MRYYYDPETGIFKFRTTDTQPRPFPYVEMPRYWPWHLHRIDTETGEIVEINT